MKGMTKLMIVAMVVLAAVLIAPAAARGNASAGAFLTVKHIEAGRDAHLDSLQLVLVYGAVPLHERREGDWPPKA